MRFATFNASLNRSNAGELITDLTTSDDPQAQDIAEIIQRVNPDVLLINEFDYNAENPNQAIDLFQQNYLGVDQNPADSAGPVNYPFVYVAPSNTGVASGFDLDNNGDIVTTPGAEGYGNDALGFGNFPGQFGMVFLSKFPIVEEQVRTFQNFLWEDMPNALLPDDPTTPEENDWYSEEELDVLPLSSKSHWDIPVEVDGEIIHVLASHPTPPTFDDPPDFPEGVDFNGRRNHDEIRFWADYVTPDEGDYIYDDDGNSEAPTGGLPEGSAFVIMGDQNADPFDGDSTDDAILQLIENPNIVASATDVNITPDSEGGVVAAETQGGANDDHEGNPAFDTADFGFDEENPTVDAAPGNLRVDYVLPSDELEIEEAEVFWPVPDTPGSDLVDASDHRLVYADLAFEEETDPGTPFTLELLHTADQEAGIPAITDAVNFSAVLNGLEADPEFENTLKLTSGDVFIAGPFFNTSREIYGEPGIADILINNALGFQASAIGNHEFDLGPDALNTLIRPDAEITGPGIPEGGYPGTAFPYLSTNLDFTGEPDLAELVVPPANAPQPNTISDSVVIEVNGESIGVVGATTPQLPAIANIGDITVTPPDPDDINALAATIQPSVDELVNQGIDKIILLSHMQQISVEEELAELLTDVDIIMAGGSNTILANEDDPLREGDTAAGPYPIEKTSASNEPVFVINTDGSYQYVGRLIADFDANGIITGIGEQSGAYATDEAGVDRVYEEDVNPADVADPTVVAVTSAIDQIIQEKEGNVFGLTEVFLNGTRADVRTQETNLGNLSADANLDIAQEYDEDVIVSIKNGGGIRDNIGNAFVPPGGVSDELVKQPPQAIPGVKEEGEISQLDIENTLRFNNDLSLLTVTAAELKQILEHGVAEVAPGSTPGQFPQVGGLQFTYDPTQQAIEFERDEEQNATGVATEGERIVSLEIVDDEGNVVDTVVENGEIIGNESREIRLVTLGFLANGGDSYPFPLFGENRVNLVEQPAPEDNIETFAEDGTEQDALAEYLAETFPADDDESTPAFTQEDTPPEEDQRIQQVEVDTTPQPQPTEEVLEVQGRFETRIFDESASEISAFDSATQRAFVTNGFDVSVDIIDFSNPAEPTRLQQIDFSPFGSGVNSIALFEGLIAVAVEATDGQAPGQIFFLDTDGNIQGEPVTVGVLPDMLTFTPDGSRILVANEGEPNEEYTVDPEGSVSIIDVETREVTNATFTDFNDQIDELREAGVRIFGPNATVAQDLEPEYITVSADSTTAYVALQENNAIAVLDIAAGTVTDILPLGFKDRSQVPLDASNEDGEINLDTYPNLFGMYQPDAIATYEANGQTYIVTANEGDSRDYDGFSEEISVGELTLDTTAFPNAAELQLPENLGNLLVTNTLGDTDGDGEYEELYAYGGRSFSIWQPGENGLNLVFDSGDQFERITSARFPDFFNASNTNNEFDNRSDDKGPEPEAITIGEIDGKTYAFIGLERIGGVMTYDITDPTQPQFVEYLNPRNFEVDPEAGTLAGTVEDLGPEGITFVGGDDPKLIVTNEVSGTTTAYSITSQNSAPVFSEDIPEDLSLGELQNLSDPDNLEGISIGEFVGEITVDNDNDNVGIAIAGVDTTNGTWQYSTDNGETWIEITGVSQESAILLSSTAEIRFVASGEFTGTIERAITFFAWDGTFGESGTFANVTQTGQTTAFSENFQTASLTVIEQQNIPPVVAEEIPNQSGQVNIGFSLNVADNFSDEDNDPLTFSSPNLPAGLTLDEDTGRIIGTPVNAGTFNVTVVASDSEAEVETSFEFQVSPFVIPEIPPLPEDNLGEPPVDDDDDDDDDDDEEPPVDDGDDEEPPVDDDDDDDDDGDDGDDGETPEPPVPPVDVEIPVRQPNTTTNTVEGDQDDNELLGTDEGEDLLGFQGSDILPGLNGDDNIYGGSGDDLILAGLGNDNVYGDRGNDSIFGGIGGTIPGDDESDLDYIEGGNGNDIIFGNTGSDTILGGEGNDIVFAGKGDDLVSGGEGDDFITGDEGNDTLLGGEGRDRFLFVEGSGTDTIADYEDGRDLFVLGEGLTFDQLTITQVSGLTQIQVSSTEEVLAALPGVAVGDIGEEDFTLFEPIETPLDS